MSKTYLVTGAAGKMGRSVVSTLLSLGHRVHALTRNPSSNIAQELKSNGAVLFKGDFSSPSELSVASKDCSGIFVLTIPGPDAAIYASTVVSSFRSACLPDPVVVLVTSIFQSDGSTKLIHSPNGGLNNKGPHPFIFGYWKANNDVETVIKASGIPHWTIFRPGYFMSNYTDATFGFHWPELSTNKELVAGVRPDTEFELIDPHDIGVFAAHALVEKGHTRWEHKCLDLAGEVLTLEEIAAIITRVGGIPVKAVLRDEQEAAKLAEDDFMGYVHFMQKTLSPTIDVEDMRRYGFKLGTFEAYLTKHKDGLIRALNNKEDSKMGLSTDEQLAAAGQHGK